MTQDRRPGKTRLVGRPLDDDGAVELHCVPRNDLAAVEAANVALNNENAQLRQALRVIRKGLSDESDGNYWPARRWLDRRNIFHDDLSGHRVLELIARHVLHGDKSCLESCVCDVEDGLVQEWVQKARSVARSKGLLP